MHTEPTLSHAHTCLSTRVPSGKYSRTITRLFPVSVSHVPLLSPPPSLHFREAPALAQGSDFGLILLQQVSSTVSRFVALWTLN